MEKGCPSCGRMIDAALQKCPHCNYDFSELNIMYKTYEKTKEIKIPKYAGLIKRMAANTIDSFFLFAIFTILELLYLIIFYPSIFGSFKFTPIMFLPYMLLPIVYLIYCTFMESSSSMATLGEQLVGIEVLDEHEGPMTIQKSFVRNILKIVNVLTFGVGIIFIAFSPYKQAFNDRLSFTFVVNKITDENYAGFEYAHLFKRFSAFMIDILVLIVIYLAAEYLLNLLSDWDSDYKNLYYQLVNILRWSLILLYFPYMEAYRTTFGKKIMHIRTFTLSGERIAGYKSIVIFISFLVELVMFPFATLLAFVTPRKQTFKDILNDIVVIDY